MHSLYTHKNSERSKEENWKYLVGSISMSCEFIEDDSM